MNDGNNQSVNQWTDEWLTATTTRNSTMSQRKLSSVNKYGGGMGVVKAVAQQKGIHLLQITDDKGVELVVASTQSFTVIC